MKSRVLSDAVSRIAWGYILIHIHFNLGVIDILPDWLAYIFFYQAIDVIQREEPSAKLLKPFAVILAIENVISIFTGSIQLVNILISVISLYFHFQLLTNLASLAKRYGCKEEQRILTLRTVRTILLTIIMLPVPWNDSELLTIGILIINLVVAFWICAVLFGFKNSLKIAENIRME